VGKTRSRSIAKGLVAGLIGGIVGTAARNVVEKAYPPRKTSDIEPELVTHRIGGRELTVRQRRLARQGMHWGIGASAGAAYGVAAEFYPAATSKQGASFGMALIALNQDHLLPTMGLAGKQEQTRREHTSELASFVTYGVVTETVRWIVRRMID
jgi:putative membrane protein